MILRKKYISFDIVVLLEIYRMFEAILLLYCLLANIESNIKMLINEV